MPLMISGAGEFYDQRRKIHLAAAHVMRLTQYIIITPGSSWELRHKYVNQKSLKITYIDLSIWFFPGAYLPSVVKKKKKKTKPKNPKWTAFLHILITFCKQLKNKSKILPLFLLNTTHFRQYYRNNNKVRLKRPGFQSGLSHQLSVKSWTSHLIPLGWVSIYAVYSGSIFF